HSPGAPPQDDTQYNQEHSIENEENRFPVKLIGNRCHRSLRGARGTRQKVFSHAGYIIFEPPGMTLIVPQVCQYAPCRERKSEGINGKIEIEFCQFDRCDHGIVSNSVLKTDLNADRRE